MPYNQTGLVVHDADAHIMETPTWLRDHADPAIRDRIEPLRYPGGNELRQTSDTFTIGDGDPADPAGHTAGNDPADPHGHTADSDPTGGTAGNDPTGHTAGSDPTGGTAGSDPDGRDRDSSNGDDRQRHLDAAFGRLAAKHASDEYRAAEEAEIMARKNFAATGSFVADDRPRALDLLGFASQLVFNTFHNRRLHDWEHSGDIDLAIGAARAHNRGMVEFCAVDPRLLPTCYVPLADLERAPALADEAIAAGAAALLVASGCPPGHSPSHVGLDGVWARAEEAGIPVVFHVGGTGDLVDPAYFANGLPVPPDFHGGEENFRSVDYMGIPGPPAQTLATMIFDGVLERFPDLRIGVIEQGAIWVPSWTRQMESAFDAFARHEQRLQTLSLRPAEYVRRQVRFTPYPTEDVGWIIEQAGPEVCLFSSDYPHVEGGRRPIERFEASLAASDVDPYARQRFYADNFADLMGTALAPLGA